ncbi:MAG: serine/threonine protein kinase, partial [Muribaculaceae bacterium]|nr:serine/threonine protein kinase [Muribaculaceae bacterium]
MIEVESGYIGETESSCYVRSAMSDVEIIRVSSSNIIARGRRYGRYWLLKGLREELQGSTLMRRRLMKEFEIHSRLLNPAVAQAVALEEIEGLGLCIVEEWIEGKTLSELIREDTLSKPDRRRIMREIIKVTAYLHGKGVVHRDLKPSNIMVREAGGEAVLIDFGLADTDDYAEIKQPAGSEGFISPEQRLSGGAETSDDVYSLGIIMLELCHEYGSIARKCIGSVESRPKDAGVLLKALDSHDRKPKKIMVSVISLFITTLILLAAIHIKTLSEAFESAEKQVANITEENSNNAKLVTELTDSLNVVTGRMNDAETELRRAEEYSHKIENAYKEGHRLIDETLARYDRDVFSKFTPENNEDYTKAWSRMNNELIQFADSISNSAAAAALTDTDREKVRLDMIQYYTVKLSKYQDKWIKKIFPT